MWSNLKSYMSHTSSASVGAAFTIMSLVFGTWITRIPDIKDQTELSEAELGLALLGMPVGAIVIMLFMGALIHRFGAGRLTWVASVCYVLSLILPALASGIVTLTLALVLVGASAGAMDVAMNAAAAIIEKQQQKLIMSTSHALWSLGAMIGAAVGSLVVGLGISPLMHFAFTSLVLLVLIMLIRRHWIKISGKQEGTHRWALPTKGLIGLAFIGFCVLLAEGAIADWSALYIRETLGGSAFLGGFGFAGFSLTMALGRFYGDIVTPKWGKRKIVTLGALITGLAMVALLLVGHPAVAIVGFTIAGVGLSCVVPIVFSSAANTPGVSPGSGIASVSSMGYFGFMVGPPAIGFVAEGYGLDYGLGLVVLLCLLFGVTALAIKD